MVSSSREFFFNVWNVVLFFNFFFYYKKIKNTEEMRFSFKKIINRQGAEKRHAIQMRQSFNKET